MPFIKGHTINYGMKGKKHSKATKRKMRKAQLGKNHLETTKRKISKTMTGRKLNYETWNKGKTEEKSIKWKGDGAGYSAMHKWIVRQKGNAKDQLCKCGRRAQEWSNINHKYRRILKDYVARCYKCHGKYDKEHKLLVK